MPACDTCGDAGSCLDCLSVDRGGPDRRKRQNTPLEATKDAAERQAEVGYLRHEMGNLQHSIGVLQEQREVVEAECERLRVELAAERTACAKAMFLHSAYSVACEPLSPAYLNAAQTEVQRLADGKNVDAARFFELSQRAARKAINVDGLKPFKPGGTPRR